MAERVLNTEEPVNGEKPIVVSIGVHGGESKQRVLFQPGAFTVAQALEREGFSNYVNDVRNGSKKWAIKIKGNEVGLDHVLNDDCNIVVLPKRIEGAD